MLSVREDALELFGFADQAELNCFRQLTAVSGVGPKAAAAVLSELSPEKVALAAGLRGLQDYYQGAGRAVPSWRSESCWR